MVAGQQPRRECLTLTFQPPLLKKRSPGQQGTGTVSSKRLRKHVASEKTKVVAGCPAHLAEVEDGYTAVHARVCYLFVDDELFWNKARDHCYRLGGEMLNIQNAETMKFIAATLDSPELGWRRNGVWLGLRHTSRGWRWTNGHHMTYENWSAGEPSRVLKFLAVEDCVQMRRKHNWEWHDYPCGSMKFHYNYVCEFPLGNPSDPEGQVSPSASSQEEDNGNSFILFIIIGLGVAILLMMLVIALLLHVHHRRTKRRQADPPVHYSNNTNHVNHHTSSNTNSSSSGSNGSAPRTCAIPSGRPPLPPPDRGENDPVNTPFLYSEVNRARTPHLQMVSFPKRQQHLHNQTNPGASSSAAPSHSTEASTSSPHTTYSQLLRGGDSDLDLDLERAPLMTPATSGDQLFGSNPGLENTGTASSSSSFPPSFSSVMGGAAMAENQANSLNGAAPASSGDYVDMNSMMTRERQGRGDSQVSVKREVEPKEEDKHTYTNVDHRSEKVENLYEVLP
ncbi:cell wall integrity and stress response component 4-like [Plakobranchus ocellatus]|uniref:Cell wall integrity and stress response component 4-like n=1 Tax=Plakobranchus ocellatus TaxID=259542 RepID=A0AAV4AV13_9GAST|nr:cell wall integrity and stress response component 4-like [Plakobranchus ocellatus]